SKILSVTQNASGSFQKPTSSIKKFKIFSLQLLIQRSSPSQ
ncbi:19958_t:CDS:1, partial [Dentiscutata erythropus]